VTPLNHRKRRRRRVTLEPAAAAIHAREALAIDPNLAPAWLAIAANENSLGDYPAEETALGKAETLIQGRGHGGYSDKMLLESHAIAANRATFTGNYRACTAEARSALPLTRDRGIRADLDENWPDLLQQSQAVEAVLLQSSSPASRDYAERRAGHAGARLDQLGADRRGYGPDGPAAGVLHRVRVLPRPCS
jgi:hypothetical protein